MDEFDPIHAHYVNQTWDAFLLGSRGGTVPRSGETIAAIQWVHDLGTAPPADAAFLAQLRADLLAPNRRISITGQGAGFLDVIPESPARIRTYRMMPFSRRWRWPVANVATVALILLTIGFVGIVYPATRSETPGIAPLTDTAYEIEMLASADAMAESDRLVHLDPLTLADRPDEDPIELGGPSWASIISADGSTLVTVVIERTATNPEPNEASVHVRDGATGRVLAEYILPLTIRGPGWRLSQDGSRLIVEAMPTHGQPPPSVEARPEWHVIETATGKTLATIPSDPDKRWSTETWIDPDARRLYRLLLPRWPDDTGPGPALIVAHDLTTGREIGRLTVPDVQGGTWDTGREIPYPVDPAINPPLKIIGELQPGGTLSPDGHRLALVHADGDEVTLIDTERLTIERTVSFAHQASLADRVWSALSPFPQNAAAKMPPEGTAVSAAFAADGRRLYTWGTRTTVSDDGQVTGRRLPLRLIDTEQGEIIAETANDGFTKIQPSADGASLYVTFSGPVEPDGDHEPPMILRRLDAMTLEIEAERSFTGYPRIFFRPDLPRGNDGHMV